MRQYLNDPVGDRPGDTVVERLEKLINSRYEGRLVTWPWAHTKDEQWPLKNVWPGTSVEDQPTADERISHVMETLAAVRGLSVEPLLSEVDIRLRPDMRFALQWVVVGGESGPGFRPMDPEWARFIREQCRLSGIPFFHEADGWQGGDPSEPDDQRVPELKEIHGHSSTTKRS